jgi:phosphatidylglycerol:prolipoprotein diacylglycerol transferase
MTQGLAAHVILELLAYAVGGMVYRLQFKSASNESSTALQKLAVVAGAVFGAALGSRLLYMLDYLEALKALPTAAWFSGKTIVGALLGGLIGVEIAKKFVGWTNSTGDRFVWPLLIGMMIGRMGCQLAGLTDLTYGGETTLPWGWDYGDGVLRHPVAIYEIIGLAGIGALVHFGHNNFKLSGDRFKLFLILYLLLRIALDFLKPPHVPVANHMLMPSNYLGLSAIHWACIAGLIYYAPTIKRWTMMR